MQTKENPMPAIHHLLLWVWALTLSATVLAGPQVPVLRVGPQAVSSGYELDGVVEAVRQATVAAQATGRVASLLVKVGDRVKAGQVLATIDDRDTQTGVARSQAQVAQAGRQGAGAGAQQARLAQSFTQVTAPFDGYVSETLAQAGDLAVPGKPVATVYAPQPLRVVVQLPAAMAPQARSAQRAELQAGGQWVAPTALHSVAAADPVSQTLTWKLDVGASAAAQLLPGQQTRVRFVGGLVQRMVVPHAAVLRRGELTAVYVAGDKGFVLKAVRLGAEQGAAGIEGLAGLKAGDAVAVNAVQAGLAGAEPV